jgi:DNA-binding MarR family transcriptional regulator
MERLDVVGLLNAAQQLERNVAISLMYSGLRLAQFRLLDRIASCRDITVTEVSRRMNITRATASVMINELIRSGVLAVIDNPTDRRSFHVRLTELGMNKLNVARSDLSVLMDTLSTRYPAETIRALNGFAQRMLERESTAPKRLR